MNRPITISGLLLVVTVITALILLRRHRYELLAISDMRAFASSNSCDLYAGYPHLVDRIANDSELAAKVESVHLSVSDFSSQEWLGRDSSSLSRLPNLKTVTCTYSENVNSIVPVLNTSRSLRFLRLYNCRPLDEMIAGLNSQSLRHIEVYGYNDTDVIALATFANSNMPECRIEFTTGEKTAEL